ncbi:hypothetical protein [Brachybacterium sp. UMB0905]|uniref:hypothetical protein n=1 Tax=Brachybacterium sp. UMB0905 TaxID=2069310 RepID=UPI000C8053BE|nr:hypothetical protein [Brachybacterium sp. UMB0905]PMC74572.1 hypothetical protein CJ197_12780 [Brachybacterium sp. UMB0905]
MRELDLVAGGLPRRELLAALDAAGVRRNPSAETLLEHPVFEQPSPQRLHVRVASLAELGFAEGATFPQVMEGIEVRGLAPCPPVTGPYLRLAMPDQEPSADPRLSIGRAPDAAITVLSPRLRPEVEFPLGFYLRVVQGVTWLRGFRADDEWVLSDTDVLAVAVEGGKFSDS